MSLHIDTKGKVAETVLMPGDPLRAKFVAENFLTEPAQYTSVRNILGYTGTYKGVPVSVQGSGMGMPSIGIYSWELFNDYDVQNIIRVGTCGAFRAELNIGEIVLALAASTDSNYNDMFNLNGTYAPSCSYSLLRKTMKVADETGISYTAGNILSSDHFYEADPDWWKAWQKMGVMGVEMEAAALYANAAYLGKNALGIMTVSDNFVTEERATSEEREKEFMNMINLALEVAIM